MLTKMLPDQISKSWPIIKYAVEQSLPPIVGEHPDKLNRILAAALSDKIDVWASYVRNGDNAKFEGIVLTKIIYDDPSQTKNLLIYCVYGYEAVSNTSWLHGIEMLSKYAKSKECSQIVAYTNLPYIVEISRRLGASTDYTFVSFDVDKTIQNLDELKRR